METGCAIVHSDDAVGNSDISIKRQLRQWLRVIEQAMKFLRLMLLVRWITSNPAKAAGMLDQTGSIEVGKDADIVLDWGNPFSVYSRAEKVFNRWCCSIRYEQPQNSTYH